MPVNINRKDFSSRKGLIEKEANLLLHQLFTIYDEKYFYCKLTGNVRISWSKRMTSCAGCTLQPDVDRICNISLSRPLLELRPLEDLLETLLHEMIHAYLWVTKENEHQEHGPKFHAEKKRIEKRSGMKLEIFHEFHSECHHLQTHVWKCNGPCRKSNYEHRVIRRAQNRPPSNKEKWFRIHANICGGTFVKVKEPSEKKFEFNPRIEEELRTYISKTWKITIEAMKKPASSSESDFSSDSDDMILNCYSWSSYSDSFSDSDFSTDEESAAKSTAQVTPVKENRSKTASTQDVLLTPPPTENKHTKMRVLFKSSTESKLTGVRTVEAETSLPLDKKTTKSTTRDKPATLLTKNTSKKLPETSKNSAAKEKAKKTEAPAKVSSVKKKPADSSSKTAKTKKKELPTNEKTKMAPKFPEKTKKYKWQCYGPCQNEAPMFGRVERLINRPPNTREKWFLLHEKNCGGSFVRLD
ncbi:sprT-like domain-containing protein Spartan isoform X3 [Octopus sinensis]|uniref:SprT-like domain-containing protein Spartan isoform X3 n=1 Tax=Octopus sinensis TaxID=2607531 RepID=A0A6P7U1E8_9MOLL|nr:sprT-like domain-containing protein Spartan isoform X3 [Octopus sinensis]